MGHRAAARPVDGDTVDETRPSVGLSGAYGSGEETQGARLDGREPKPADIDPDRARLIHWQKCYRALWELKLAFEKQHNS